MLQHGFPQRECVGRALATGDATRLGVDISYKRIFYKMFICTKYDFGGGIVDKRVEFCGIMWYNESEDICHASRCSDSSGGKKRRVPW